MVAFAYSSFLCTSVKLYIMTSVLLLGMLGYFVTEWILRKEDNFDLEQEKISITGVDMKEYYSEKEGKDI